MDKVHPKESLAKGYLRNMRKCYHIPTTEIPTLLSFCLVVIYACGLPFPSHYREASQTNRYDLCIIFTSAHIDNDSDIHDTNSQRIIEPCYTDRNILLDLEDESTCIIPFCNLIKCRHLSSNVVTRPNAAITINTHNEPNQRLCSTRCSLSQFYRVRLQPVRRKHRTDYTWCSESGYLTQKEYAMSWYMVRETAIHSVESTSRTNTLNLYLQPVSLNELSNTNHPHRGSLALTHVYITDICLLISSPVIYLRYDDRAEDVQAAYYTPDVLLSVSECRTKERNSCAYNRERYCGHLATRTQHDPQDTDSRLVGADDTNLIAHGVPELSTLLGAAMYEYSIADVSGWKFVIMTPNDDRNKQYNYNGHNTHYYRKHMVSPYFMKILQLSGIVGCLALRSPMIVYRWYMSVYRYRWYMSVYRCSKYFDACDDKSHDIPHRDKPHIRYLIPIVLLICLTCKDHMSVSVIRATRTYVSVNLIIGKIHSIVDNDNGLCHADYSDSVCAISNYSDMTINRYDQVDQHTSWCSHTPCLPILTRLRLNMIVCMSDLEPDVCKESPSREINTPHEPQE